MLGNHNPLRNHTTFVSTFDLMFVQTHRAEYHHNLNGVPPIIVLTDQPSYITFLFSLFIVALERWTAPRAPDSKRYIADDSINHKLKKTRLIVLDINVKGNLKIRLRHVRIKYIDVGSDSIKNCLKIINRSGSATIFFKR